MSDISSTELEMVIKKYVAAARQSGYAPGTMEKYRWHLEKLTGWLIDRSVTRLDQVTRSLLREWRTGLPEAWSPATVRQAVAAARAFFGWCQKEGLMAALRLPKVKKQRPRLPTIEEIEALLAACDSSAKGKRDAALISLIVDSGLGPSAICRLKVTDVWFDVRLADGSRGNFCQVHYSEEHIGYFGRATARRLKIWLEAREQIGQANTEELFVSIRGIKPGTRLCRDGVRVILGKLAEEAGLEGMSPLRLRRAFIRIRPEADRLDYRKYSPMDFIEER